MARLAEPLLAVWDWFFYGHLLAVGASPAETLWTLMAVLGFLLNLIGGYDALGDLAYLRQYKLNGARELVARGHLRNAVVRGAVKFGFLLVGVAALSSPPPILRTTTLPTLVVVLVSGIGGLTWCDFRDRSDRRRLLHLLAHRRSLIDPAIDSVLTIDADSVIRAASVGGAATFGYLPGELIGQTLAAVLAPEEYAAHRERMREYLATGETTTLGRPRHAIGLTKAGEALPLEATFVEVGIGAARRWTVVLRQMGAIERED